MPYVIRCQRCRCEMCSQGSGDIYTRLSRFIPDAENKESLSKNGITHILSVYNNAKPVFEVSGKIHVCWMELFLLPVETLHGKFGHDCAYTYYHNVMCPVSQLGVVMSYGWRKRERVVL